MANNENLIPIPGRLHSVATEGHVAGADEIYDDSLQKDQATINQEVSEALGEGGTVDEKIAAAIEDVAYIDDTESSSAVAPSFDPESQTVHVTAQTLSEQQKAQVRDNIGLGDVDTKINEAVASEASQRTAAVSGVQASVNAETSRAQTAENTLNQKLSLLNGSEIIVVEDHTQVSSPDSQKVYREQGESSYTDWMYQNNEWKKIATYNYGIDDEPTAGSDNLVKSGGVQEELALGTVYDVSAKNPTAGPNNDGKFESLSALLEDTNLDTLIPTSVRKGGMSIKFVQSFDNKYVKFFCTEQNFTTDVAKWINVIDEIDKIENKIFDFEIVVPDSSTGYLDAQGRKQSNANCLCSDFISVNNGDVLELKGTYARDTTMPAVWGYSAADQTTAVKGLLWYWNSNEFVCRFVIDDDTINYIRAFALKSGGLTIKKVSDYTLENEKTNGVKTVASNSGYLNTTGGNSALATAVYTNYIKVSVGDIIYYVGKYVKDDTLPAIWGYSDTKNSGAVPILNFVDSNMLVKKVTITDSSVKYIRAWGLAESGCYVVKNGFTEASLIESLRLDDVVEKCAENNTLITKYKTYGHFANGYINENGVIVSGNENLHRTDYIPVSKGDKVTYVGGYVRGNFPAMYAYDANKNPLRALIQFTGNDLSKSIFIEDSDIAYIVAFSLVTDFSEVWVKVEGLNILGKNKSQIIVDAKGNGDYTSLDDAINNVYDVTDTISILVMPGTYSMSAYNTSTRWRESKRNISIVGVDKNKCIIQNDNGYYKVNPYEDNSTLKIVGNVFLQNLTFISTADNYTEEDVTYKKAYCLHIDYITNDDSIYEVNNCRFINDHNSCIGIGLKNKFTVKIINCELQSTGGESATIFCHDGENATDQKLIIKDCIIESANGKAVECGIAYNNGYQVTLINNTIDTTNKENSFIKAAAVTLSQKCHGNNVTSMNV